MWPVVIPSPPCPLPTHPGAGRRSSGFLCDFPANIREGGPRVCGDWHLGRRPHGVPPRPRGQPQLPEHLPLSTGSWPGTLEPNVSVQGCPEPWRSGRLEPVCCRPRWLLRSSSATLPGVPSRPGVLSSLGVADGGTVAHPLSSAPTADTAASEATGTWGGGPAGGRGPFRSAPGALMEEAS